MIIATPVTDRWIPWAMPTKATKAKCYKCMLQILVAKIILLHNNNLLIKFLSFSGWVIRWRTENCQRKTPKKSLLGGKENGNLPLLQQKKKNSRDASIPSPTWTRLIRCLIHYQTRNQVVMKEVEGTTEKILTLVACSHHFKAFLCINAQSIPLALQRS